MDNTCVAIKTDGDKCSHRKVTDNRCLMHHKKRIRDGPNRTDINEEIYKHRRQLNELYEMWDKRIDAEFDNAKRTEMIKDEDTEVALLKANHKRIIREIERRQHDMIQTTGVDPDQEANLRRRERDLERQNRNRLLMLQRVAGFQAQQAVALAEFGAQVQRDDPNENLRAFTNDPQNVHTRSAVQQTKDIVQRILNIPVPEEYQWNMNYCSKTPGEIIIDCKLTPKAAWQMQAKYSQDDDIYDMGKGIYGKTLDGVWQYIRGSKEKADIISALRQELEDSIGMCAQGNLSRICNILAGFMDGVGSQESLAEMLGRQLPLLLDIENHIIRMKEAINIMGTNGVPKQEWLVWIEPLFDDVPDDKKTQLFGLLA